MQYDLLIKDGFLVDGSGLPGYQGDLAIADGNIVAMGKVDGPAKRRSAQKGLSSLPVSLTCIRIMTPSSFGTRGRRPVVGTALPVCS